MVTRAEEGWRVRYRAGQNQAEKPQPDRLWSGTLVARHRAPSMTRTLARQWKRKESRGQLAGRPQQQKSLGSRILT